MAYSFGIDVGGTFTDFIALDDGTGEVRVGKQLTTPHDPSVSILSGMAAMAQADPAPSRIVHGTTLVTNTIIERKGACTALLTTAGFRDTLTIGKPLRYDLYDLFLSFPDPLAPRHLRFDIAERINAQGDELKPLDEAQVRAAAAQAAQAGATSMAVCFLHSYMNPGHERRAREIIQAEFPGMNVCLSSDVVAEIGEYERTSTTVANAYVQPLMTGYLDRLDEGIGERYGRVPIRLMLSSGGITTIRQAQAYPIQLIESGPAGGAIAATYLGEKARERNILSFDMGGTTAKMCLITEGRPTRSTQFEAARVRRFMRGSGLPLRVPVIELIEIGAGGGSIAQVDTFGLLKVGPQSSGAVPGPVCYGRGGRQPTVTDADLVLGYLDARSFLGGAMILDADAAREAIEQQIARPLGVDVTEAAAGIHQVVNEMMASATRVYASERGCDPRAYTMMAFGGAGPVHAMALARSLKLRRLICPPAAGAASALGFLLAPTSLELAQSYVSRVEQLDWDKLGGIYDDLQARAREAIMEAGVAAEDITLTYAVEMSYVGQGFHITVEIDRGLIDRRDIDALRAAFIDAYAALYGKPLADITMQAVTWRLTASGPRRAFDPAVSHTTSTDPVKGRRPIYVPDDKAYGDVPVYDRYALRPGMAFDGPAVVEERESTLVLAGPCHVQVDHASNLIIDLL
ncbi:MAG: hydantoinase/oxoprolinase family protein [Candidimonas sp.]